MRLDRASLVGYVYWGKLTHTSREKAMASIGGSGDRLALSASLSSRDLLHLHSQRQGELEYVTLRALDCLETLQEQFNTRSAEQPDAETLAERVMQGPVPQAGAPSPRFAALQWRLAAAGIWAEQTEQGIAFRLMPPDGKTLALAHPVSHPYLRGQVLTDDRGGAARGRGAAFGRRASRPRPVPVSGAALLA